MSTITRITIADFDRMIAEGRFESGGIRQRIELVDGELVPMSPIGPIHDWIVQQMTLWSFNKTSEDVVAIRVQSSVAFPEYDRVQQPDVVWAQPRDYSSTRPASGDILLIIEVADTSLAYDCGFKASIYAGAGIADYWVVNIPDRCVEVFRQPERGRYRSHEVFTESDEIRPLAFPEVVLSISRIFSLGT